MKQRNANQKAHDRLLQGLPVDWHDVTFDGLNYVATRSGTYKVPTIIAALDGLRERDRMLAHAGRKETDATRS